MRRCDARTRSGAACTRAVVAGEGRCASHLGRCGAQPGNQNALKHGLYSRQLAALEAASLRDARAMDGVGEEIAVTRVLIARALRDPQLDPADVAPLLHALVAQVKVQRLLDGSRDDALAAKLGDLLDEVAGELGIA